MTLIRHIFIKTLYGTKSNDLICDLFMGQASNPRYRRGI